MSGDLQSQTADSHCTKKQTILFKLAIFFMFEKKMWAVFVNIVQLNEDRKVGGKEGTPCSKGPGVIYNHTITTVIIMLFKK